MKRLAVFGAVVVLALAAQPALANLVTNGSFEDPLGAYNDAGHPGYMTLNTGSTLIPGWTVTGVSIDWLGGGLSNPYVPAQDLDKCLDLAGTPGPGGVVASTSIATAIGQAYQLDFWLNANGGGLKTLTVDVGGNTTTFTYDAAVDLGLWVQKSVTFVANSTTTALGFATPDGGNAGPALDNVSVTAGTGGPPVPEPVTMFSAFMGLSSLGMYIRKRMKKQAAV